MMLEKEEHVTLSLADHIAPPAPVQAVAPGLRAVQALAAAAVAAAVAAVAAAAVALVAAVPGRRLARGPIASERTRPGQSEYEPNNGTDQTVDANSPNLISTSRCSFGFRIISSFFLLTPFSSHSVNKQLLNCSTSKQMLVKKIKDYFEKVTN